MKRFLLAIVCVMVSVSIYAQDFDKWFSDKTLRIDYIFSGNDHEQHIAVDELCQEPRWYGKRQRLAEVPVEGNGQITVRDHKTGRVIYRNSFSTLFKSGSHTLRLRQRQRVSKMYSLCQCRKTPLTLLLTCVTTAGR